ncbi:magnesium transporter CorA family protein [Rhodoferax sp.]|uniref:magnesium transporter CorA family protein n=1 Tax=Rhodoferax sp. TaxID=50421 RepID=UPI00262F2397|nr:magnesium transporter CorA family protein [Rhodoferax sp.]MDD5479015.1 magnesium transporter CorA family protein [Rhodoferax sp.]
MRLLSIHANQVTERQLADPAQLLASVPLSEQGYLWLMCTREELAQFHTQLQAALLRLCGVQMVDLHVSDLLNVQLPSRYDFTSQYDLLVFRRLSTRPADNATATEPGLKLGRKGGPPILRRIDTSPIGFVVFERLLLSVHPQDVAPRDAYVNRLLATTSLATQPLLADNAPDNRSTGARGIAADPADLMLRIVNHMVDGFLALRRELSQQLDHWQAELLNPKTRFSNWSALLDARLALHQLDALCEDQRSAMQDWLEALKTQPECSSLLGQHAHDMLQVRSRDVLEHIERVVHHVRRLEQNAETAVQMHFNAQSHRTNEIMRTLTVLTAIFLPLNLIAGIFGMNFEFIPLLHQSNGFWLAMTAMVLIATSLVAFFWRKRYLERSAR